MLNGHKWWITGAAHPHCRICIFMGRVEGSEDAPRHQRHSMVLVPMDAEGLQVVRPLRALGFEDAPHGHCELRFDDVRVPAASTILGSGRGFEIAQATRHHPKAPTTRTHRHCRCLHRCHNCHRHRDRDRPLTTTVSTTVATAPQARLGPGRIHHCMRLIGMAERSVELACQRAASRVAFGKPLSEQGVVLHQIARSRIEIEQCRLLTLHAAGMIDRFGAKQATPRIGTPPYHFLHKS